MVDPLLVAIGGGLLVRTVRVRLSDSKSNDASQLTVAIQEATEEAWAADWVYSSHAPAATLSSWRPLAERDAKFWVCYLAGAALALGMVRLVRMCAVCLRRRRGRVLAVKHVCNQAGSQLGWRVELVATCSPSSVVHKATSVSLTPRSMCRWIDGTLKRQLTDKASAAVVVHL